MTPPSASEAAYGLHQRVDPLAAELFALRPGNQWLLDWRRAVNGVCARAMGVDLHVLQVSRWDLTLHAFEVTGRLQNAALCAEYNLASAFFHMDSALEILVFALNSLGFALAPDRFEDVTRASGRKAVKPWKVAEPQYADWFPAFVRAWNEGAALRDRVTESHDVSKHRTAVWHTGKVRTDPPTWFATHPAVLAGRDRALLAPYATFWLASEPRQPDHGPVIYDHASTLAALYESFCGLLNGLVVAFEHDLHAILAKLAQGQG